MTLAGDDVVATKAPPSQELVFQIGKSGLEGLVGRFERRLLNLSHWSEDYAQKKNYEIFKNFFVFSAAYFYGKMGHYPTTRAETASLFTNQKAAQLILSVTNSMQNASKANQKLTIEAGFLLIEDLTGR